MQKPALRRVLRNVLLAVSVTALSGCSMFSSTNPRYEPAPLTEYAPGVSAAITWSTRIGSGGGYGFAPVVVGDSVFAATPDGSVRKVDLTTGAIQWQANTDRDLTAGVGSDGHITAVAA